MKDSAKYLKVVEWSDEDQCFIGSAPGLLFGGCHGMNEQEVFNDLCKIVDETIALYKREGRSLPAPTYGRGILNQLETVA